MGQTTLVLGARNNLFDCALHKLWGGGILTESLSRRDGGMVSFTSLHLRFHEHCRIDPYDSVAFFSPGNKHRPVKHLT